jgi:peptide/nickel transport system substrate-binding protein
VVEAQTLDFTLKAPDPLFPGRLTLGILPARMAAAAADENGDANARSHPGGNRGQEGDARSADRGGLRPGEAAVVGSGPFRLLNRVPGGDLLLERRSDGLRLWLRGLQDPLTRLRRIEAGEADIAQGELGPAILAWARGQPGLRVLATTGDSLSYLGLNLRDRALADPRLRTALHLALDRRRLAQRLLAGHARPADGLLGPGHWAGGGEAQAPEGDAARARALLTSLGISPAAPLRLTLATSANPERLRLAAALAAELAAFGIQFEIASSDWAAFYAAVRQGRFQACLMQWVGLKLPDIYRHAFHSASLPPTGANRGGVNDATLDALIEAAEAATEADAPAAWQAVGERVQKTLPQLPLWFEDATAVVGPRVRDYPLGADGSLDGLATVRLH